MTQDPKEQMQQRDREFQIRQLERIFDQARFAPVFRRNPKYCCGNHATSIPYISFADIMSEQCVIRAGAFGEDGDIVKSNDGEVLSRYNSLEELVEDGWRLD